MKEKIKKSDAGISIIIVSYNTSEVLKNCLTSIYKNLSEDISFEVIVVDNASTDNSLEMIKTQFSKVTVIANTENEGFSKANNKGVRVAKGEYLLFLNPDTEIVAEDTLKVEQLIEFLHNHPQVGAVTPKVLLPNGSIDDACHRGFPTPWNAFCHFAGLAKLFPKSKIFSGYSLGWKDLGTTHEIDACAGACMLVKREAGEQVGWWDEDYFWYGEDIDFCYRLKEKDWRIYYIPSSTILHLKGVSGGIKKISQHLSTADRETKIHVTQARFDAMKIFYKKHYTNIYPKFLTWVVMKGIDLKLKSNLFSL